MSKAAASCSLSPCIGVCRINEHKLCEGCWRSLDEIAAWSGLDEAAQRAVLDQLADRQRQYAEKLD